MNQQKGYFRKDEELRALAEAFEACSLPDEAFDHRAHLAVALWYLSRMSAEEASQRMREGLLRFLAHYEVDAQKYNETITQFWVRRLDMLLGETDRTLSLAERANQTIDRAGDSQTIFKYYSRERVFSEAGRVSWIEPDLRSLDS
jgi:hypothetical protein